MNIADLGLSGFLTTPPAIAGASVPPGFAAALHAAEHDGGLPAAVLGSSAAPSAIFRMPTAELANATVLTAPRLVSSPASPEAQAAGAPEAPAMAPVTALVAPGQAVAPNPGTPIPAVTAPLPSEPAAAAPVLTAPGAPAPQAGTFPEPQSSPPFPAVQGATEARPAPAVRTAPVALPAVTRVDAEQASADAAPPPQPAQTATPPRTEAIAASETCVPEPPTAPAPHAAPNSRDTHVTSRRRPLARDTGAVAAPAPSPVMTPAADTAPWAATPDAPGPFVAEPARPDSETAGERASQPAETPVAPVDTLLASALAIPTPLPRPAVQEPVRRGSPPERGVAPTQTHPAVAATPGAPIAQPEDSGTPAAPAVPDSSGPGFAQALRAGDEPKAPAESMTPTAPSPAAGTPPIAAAPRPAAPAAPAAPPAQPTPAAAAHEPEIPAKRGAIGNGLGLAIARSIGAGEETLRVRMTPGEFGRIDVTIAFDDSGSLRATVTADNPAALDLLRQDAGTLGRSLDQAGVRADAQSFRFEARTGDGGAGANHRESQRNPWAATRGNDRPEAAPPEYRPIRSTGRVDLLA